MALALPVSIHAYYNSNHVLCICVCNVFMYVRTCIYVSGLKPDHYHWPGKWSGADLPKVETCAETYTLSMTITGSVL